MGHWLQPDKIVELLRPVVVLVLFSWSCSTAPDRIAGQPLSGREDSLLVDSASAVFFRQDSVRMARIKAVLKKQMFESLTHDCYFEMKYARSVIQRSRPMLAMVNTSSTRWLIFSKKDGSRKTIDLYVVNDLCGVFLFDGIRDPVRANMPNIATDIWNYFGKDGE
jgi:hypothetical protein